MHLNPQSICVPSLSIALGNAHPWLQTKIDFVLFDIGGDKANAMPMSTQLQHMTRQESAVAVDQTGDYHLGGWLMQSLRVNNTLNGLQFDIVCA